MLYLEVVKSAYMLSVFNRFILVVNVSLLKEDLPWIVDITLTSSLRLVASLSMYKSTLKLYKRGRQAMACFLL